MRSAFWWLLLAASALATSSGKSPAPAPARPLAAQVLDVKVDGRAGAYTFAVRVQSPDTGCERYADWWEVVTPDGSKLLYRRVLLHAHTREQPFTRSGGPVLIDPDTEVVVRVHVKPLGYAANALKGSVATGFEPVVLPQGFGAKLAESGPLPTSCWF
ncbi:hypothetical protein Ocepr_1458 [Oceanithermus profundus DSM 14977]|uniref:Uncharacterized protein n=1 Tax=Oceanithermus profundus (strain DSM 14977 / NBRC 100410 / VKM B-2274 / 506) TaxID=670487 RepID=E4U983_OCEP5|nr:hypothetical protein [Oceanithermus profundus]ADR36912.1 hypothetical protein Ocepr_1458 [Oceanithermus profundus DSM 14977]